MGHGQLHNENLKKVSGAAFGYKESFAEND